MYSNYEVIVSNSSIILDSIQNNLSADQHIKIRQISENIKETIELYNKVNLLIIDQEFDNDNLSFYHVKTIVNLANRPLVPEEVKLLKPFKLSRLLEMVTGNRINKYIFCRLNNQWIYNEQQATLVDKKNKIKFTDRENEFFKSLLKAPQYRLHHDNVLHNILHYHQASDSSAVETQFQRLKQKLPPEFINYRNNYINLAITEIS